MKKLTLLIAFIVASTGLNAQHHKGHGDMKKTETKTSVHVNYYELNQGMRKLWSDHMHWTLATVDAFFNEPDQLNAKLTRLLDNQKHIGEAIVPFYGKEAGDKLTQLLTEHIMGAVPVLTAAKEGNEANLKVAVEDWYRNATEIAQFLSAANPENWPASATEPALQSHISHTIEYSVNILQGDYEKSIEGFEGALDHMLVLADILTDGISKQFPKKFK